MSDLRRRILGSLNHDSDSTPVSSREGSPAPGRKPSEDGTEYKVIPRKKLQKLKDVRKKGTKRRNFWIFTLGSVFGLVIAGYFASSNGSLESLIDMSGMKEMDVTKMLDVLPAGLIKDVQELQVC